MLHVPGNVINLGLHLHPCFNDSYSVLRFSKQVESQARHEASNHSFPNYNSTPNQYKMYFNFFIKFSKPFSWYNLHWYPSPCIKNNYKIELLGNFRPMHGLLSSEVCFFRVLRHKAH